MREFVRIAGFHRLPQRGVAPIVRDDIGRRPGQPVEQHTHTARKVMLMLFHPLRVVDT